MKRYFLIIRCIVNTDAYFKKRRMIDIVEVVFVKYIHFLNVKKYFKKLLAKTGCTSLSFVSKCRTYELGLWLF